jgi:hypothetical protein
MGNKRREGMDGLISFFGSYHALRAETLLKRSGMEARLIPGPKELSPNCGVALRFHYAQRENAIEVLEAKKVRIDAIHYYQPRTDEWSTKAI